ncbi:MAG: YncE family protein [Aestuariibacter sp.]
MTAKFRRYSSVFIKLSYWLLFSLSCSTFAADLSGTLVVVNKKADSVSFLDLTSKKLVATRATGKGPHEVVITQDGKWAAVTDYVGGNSLSVYDIVAAKKVREIDLSQYPQPHGILLLADQRRVAVSSEGSDSVIIADIHSGNITQVLPTKQKGSHMVALTGDTKKVYTTNMSDNSVTEIAIESNTLLRQLTMPDTPEAITINKAGTELWVGSNRNGLVTVFDMQSEKPLHQWTEFSWPYRILLTQDENFAVVPDFRMNTLDIIDARQKTTLKRLNFPQGTIPNGVTFYPDDRTLFMSAYGADKIYAIDIATGEKLFTIATEAGPDGIGYSPLLVQPVTNE